MRKNPTGKYKVIGTGFLKIPGRNRRLAAAEERAELLLAALEGRTVSVELEDFEGNQTVHLVLEEQLADHQLDEDCSCGPTVEQSVGLDSEEFTGKLVTHLDLGEPE